MRKFVERNSLILLRLLRSIPVKKGRKCRAGAILKSLFRFNRQLVVADKVLEKGCQIFIRHIPAVRFWKKRYMCNGAILIKINVYPELDAFDIKVDLTRIILHIHQDICPGSVSTIDIIMINR